MENGWKRFLVEMVIVAVFVVLLWQWLKLIGLW